MAFIPYYHQALSSQQDSSNVQGLLHEPTAATAAADADGSLVAVKHPPHTRRSYDLALSRFLNWYQMAGTSGLNKATVQRDCADLEAQGLSLSSLNVHLSASRIGLRSGR